MASCVLDTNQRSVLFSNIIKTTIETLLRLTSYLSDYYAITPRDGLEKTTLATENQRMNFVQGPWLASTSRLSSHLRIASGAL